MYGSGGIINPIAQILRQADTLQLTGLQADSLASMNRAYTVALDSIWNPVAKYLAELPEGYDQGEAYARYTEARKASVDQLVRLAPTIKSLLTEEQRRKLRRSSRATSTRATWRASAAAPPAAPAAGAFGGGFIGGGGARLHRRRLVAAASASSSATDPTRRHATLSLTALTSFP